MEKVEHLECYGRANIHDLRKLSGKKYTKIELKSGFKEVSTVFQRLMFINPENMVSREIYEDKKQDFEDKSDSDEEKETRKQYKRIRAYGANNIGHCFSRVMDFEEWEQCLPRTQRETLVINQYEVYDFLIGSDIIGRVKFQKYKHFPLPIHFLIKHNNQGKIESHKWFFKGFCRMMNPIFAQIID